MKETQETRASTGRRTLLKRIGATVAAGGVLSTSLQGVAAQEGASYSLTQGDNCVPLTPLTYEDMSAAQFYGYYKTGQEPPSRDTGDGHSPEPYEANTPTRLQKPNASRLFLYQGSDGLSLVFLHGMGGNERGGAATFRITGLPSGGKWTVQDDNYSNGERTSDRDTWGIGDNRAVIHWSWNQWHNDGGAFTGLGDDFQVQIDPAFNGNAELEPETSGTVETWEALSGSAENRDVTELSLGEPVVISSGSC